MRHSNRKKTNSIFMMCCLLSIISPVIYAQDTTAVGQPALFSGYDPGPTYPFGRPHPEAPPEIRQFDFMIGECECTDSLRQPDGSWRTMSSKWNAAYFLNGQGIQDQYWADNFATSNIRIFDRNSGTWKVTFFKKPGYSSGVWEGGKEGETMVMKQKATSPTGREGTSRLTFYNIRKEGYDWKGEFVDKETGQAFPFWKTSCLKK